MARQLLVITGHLSLIPTSIPWLLTLPEILPIVP